MQFKNKEQFTIPSLVDTDKIRGGNGVDHMITDEQLKVIKMIEENLEIKFTGDTKEGAKVFISEHIKASKKVSDHYKQLLKSNYGGYKKIYLHLESDLKGM